MPKSHKPYPEEVKHRLIEMVRAGRSPEELAEKFEPTAQSIRNCGAGRTIRRATPGWFDDRGARGAPTLAA